MLASKYHSFFFLKETGNSWQNVECVECSLGEGKVLGVLETSCASVQSITNENLLDFTKWTLLGVMTVMSAGKQPSLMMGTHLRM